MRAAKGEIAPACTFVVFGAAGDLTKRLLMPALYNLAGDGLLDDAVEIIGIDRTASSREAFRQSLTDTMETFTEDDTAEFYTQRIDPGAWAWVRERLDYVEGDFESNDLYERLAARLAGNVVFYLAIPDRFFGPVIENLGQAGLLRQRPDAFRRVIIEKPFGRDLASARALNRRIRRQAEEDQLFRIDHFLGKDVVQSILALRFSNRFFEPVWCADHIDHVQITAAETIGVEGRGAFYEPTGALRDMVPNHLFQLLAMIAMEPPASFDAEVVRSAKRDLMKSVRPVAPSSAARGQYVGGRIAGRDVRGYRDEANVGADSTTETYAALRLSIDNPRWAGVPFYLRSGKRLGARRTEIAIQFKAPSGPLFGGDADPAPNVLRLVVEPDEGTAVSFNVKAPGPAMRLETVAKTYRRADFIETRPTVGYESLIYACMAGDAALFERADTIEANWAVVDPLLKAWAEGAPQPYPAGSAGPASADALLDRHRHRWHDPEDAEGWPSRRSGGK